MCVYVLNVSIQDYYMYIVYLNIYYEIIDFGCCVFYDLFLNIILLKFVYVII